MWGLFDFNRSFSVESAWPVGYFAGEAEPKEQLQDVEDQDVS